MDKHGSDRDDRADDWFRAHPSTVVARINGGLKERATLVDQAVAVVLSAVTSGTEPGSSSPAVQTRSSSSGAHPLPRGSKEA